MTAAITITTASGTSLMATVAIWKRPPARTLMQLMAVSDQRMAIAVTAPAPGMLATPGMNSDR